MKTVLGFLPNQEGLLAVLLANSKKMYTNFTEPIALRKRNSGGQI